MVLTLLEIALGVVIKYLIETLWRRWMPKIVTQQPVKSKPSPKPSPNHREPTGNLFDDAVPVGDLGYGGMKVVLFGESGTGKTTMACSFPKPLLLLRPEAAEDGSLSVRTVDGVFVPNYMNTADQIEDVWMGQRRTGKYKTIVLDGAGDFQNLCIKKHMGWEDIKVRIDWGVVPQQDWSKVALMYMNYMRPLFQLAEQGTHVVIVAGERSVGEGSQGEQAMTIAVPHIMAAASPAITRWLHKVCDYNIHTFKRMGHTVETFEDGDTKIESRVPTGKIEFCAHVGPSDLYETKFRKPKDQELPGVVVDLTYDKILSITKGEYEE